MNFSFLEKIESIPYILLTMVIAFSVHEFSHAYVAYKFGDPTAKNQGRLTLNPKSHIDIVGAIFIVLFGFGWAKPVPVNYFFFKNPRLAGILTSLAGPLSNFILAILGFIVAGVLLTLDIRTEFLFDFLDIFTRLNIVLFIFNLFPIPPLDGFHIIQDSLSRRYKAILSQYEQYGMIVFFVIALTPLSRVTIDPAFNLLVPKIWNSMYSIMVAVVI